MPSTPLNQTGTYFRNSLRTDLFETPTLYGPGMSLGNPFYLQFAPLYGGTDLVFKSQRPEAGKPIAFNSNSSNRFYISPTAQYPNGYIQMDVLRCIEINSSSNVPSTGDAAIVTITGTDDRGVTVQEKLTCNSSDNSFGTLVSNKAYYTVTSITFSKKMDIDVNAYPSNIYFGFPYFISTANKADTDRQNTVIVIPNTFPSMSSISSSTNIRTGLNFRYTTPNDSATGYSSSRGAYGSVSDWQSSSQKDARGLCYLSANPIDSNSTVVISMSGYAYGPDSELNAKLKTVLPNGSKLTQQAYQRALSFGNPTTGGIAAPTQLTQFDLFGAQYPGDRNLFNQTFPKNKMVVA